MTGNSRRPLTLQLLLSTVSYVLYFLPRLLRQVLQSCWNMHERQVRPSISLMNTCEGYLVWPAQRHCSLCMEKLENAFWIGHFALEKVDKGISWLTCKTSRAWSYRISASWMAHHSNGCLAGLPCLHGWLLLTFPVAVEPAASWSNGKFRNQKKIARRELGPVNGANIPPQVRNVLFVLLWKKSPAPILKKNQNIRKYIFPYTMMWNFWKLVQKWQRHGW